jgi:hypothetical protein
MSAQTTSSTTDIATLYFNEGLFSDDADADVDAVYVTTLPEPATVVLLGLGCLVLVGRKRTLPESKTARYYSVVAVKPSKSPILHFILSIRKWSGRAMLTRYSLPQIASPFRG